MVISCDLFGMSWDESPPDQAKKGQGRPDEPEEGEEKAGQSSVSSTLIELIRGQQKTKKRHFDRDGIDT